MEILFSIVTLLMSIFGSIQSRTFVKVQDGVEARQLQIVNGVPADINQFPYQAGITIPDAEPEYSSICGGSLINAWTVMTAAHCFDLMPLNLTSGIKVALNSTYLDGSSVGSIVRSATQLLIHPNYTGVTATTAFDNDIALIYLNSSVTTLTPLKIPCSKSVFDGANAVIAGWGRTNGSDPYSASVTQLMSTNLTVLSNAECSKLQSFINELHLCAAHEGTDTCLGDSGGALVVNGYAIGIVSYGYDNCNKFPTFSSVSTRVGYYHDWILANSI